LVPVVSISAPPDLLRRMNLPLILFWFESTPRRGPFVSPRTPNIDAVNEEDDRD